MFTITSLPFLFTVVGRGLRGRADAPARHPQSCPPRWNAGNRGDACTADSRELQPESIKWLKTVIYGSTVSHSHHINLCFHFYNNNHSTFTLFFAYIYINFTLCSYFKCPLDLVNPQWTGQSTLTSVILFLAWFKYTHMHILNWYLKQNALRCLLKQH